MSKGNIFLEIVSASNLIACDGSSADPFVQVTAVKGLVMTDTVPFVKMRSITGVPSTTFPVNKSLSPTWNATFDFKVSVEAGSLLLTVWDHNVIQSNEEMASVEIPFETIVRNKQQNPLPFPLKNKKGAAAGEITLKFGYLSAATADIDPLEEVSVMEKGTYQFKTFTSSAASSQAADVRAANIACRDWLNKVRSLIHLIKIEQENTGAGAGITCWYQVL